MSLQHSSFGKFKNNTLGCVAMLTGAYQRFGGACCFHILDLSSFRILGLQK